MTSRKPGRRSRGAPARKSRRESTFKLWLAALFLVVFLLGSLVLLDQARHWYQASRTPPAAPPRVQLPAPLSAQQVGARLDAWLQHRGRQPARQPAGNEQSWVLVVPGPPPPGSELATLVADLEKLPGVTVETTADGGLRLAREGRRWGAIRFQPPSVPSPATEPVQPRVAIVVDDLGRNLATVRSLLAVDLPLTLSIIPGEPHATESAELAHRAGREVLVHIPMEPQGYPAVNPGRDALFVAATPAELRRRFRGYLGRVPFAVGGNNHMGSRFTEDAAGMAVVLGEMRKNGLFFLDSRTSGKSVGYEMALQTGVPAARRDVFLDNVQDPQQILGQIRHLLELARRRGSAIGICHPHGATLEALRRAGPLLVAEGIQMVPVSRLVQDPAGVQ